ncbi:exodeoxyribonuclease VII small subunit [Reichenbachiella carrageenanivorans]|uniref:Exodeoxyribonuclease VII small subunit n=1 Tax=Reichenbachiella carrageenanivorans TaxID=2979869 RepID=A0ABY6CX87_9BACT|nr:exodeoxyribonuclease VII small subunit [Reichenbachiella carrageenanivorans]UXX78520.1 exodeoxyribonuclease VII small subunit [Reichenbachiella carrageenanivorans]
MSKKKLSYQAAYDELQNICEQLESEEIDVDQITELVKRANELVKHCQDRLRGIEKDLSTVAEA